MASLPEGVTINVGDRFKNRAGDTVLVVTQDDTDIPYCVEPEGSSADEDDSYWCYAGGEAHRNCRKYDLVAKVASPGQPIRVDNIAAAINILPTDSTERKNTPVYSGVLAYFPRALGYIAQVSKAGNDKHNPGQPLHWSKDKSNDHADCAARHLIEHGTIDPDDNLRHTGKLAWRALALLETELENSAKSGVVSS